MACSLPFVDLETSARAGGGVADQAAVGVLTRTFPVDLVDRVIDQYWRREQRTRALPTRLVFYFVLVLCLFPHESYRSAMKILMGNIRSWCARLSRAYGRVDRKCSPSVGF
jgi:hypothetical protein